LKQGKNSFSCLPQHLTGSNFEAATRIRKPGRRNIVFLASFKAVFCHNANRLMMVRLNASLPRSDFFFCDRLKEIEKRRK